MKTNLTTPNATLVRSYDKVSAILLSKKFSSDRLAFLLPINQEMRGLYSGWSLFHDGEQAKKMRAELSSLMFKPENPAKIFAEVFLNGLETQEDPLSLLETATNRFLSGLFNMREEVVQEGRKLVFPIVKHTFSTPSSDEILTEASKSLEKLGRFLKSNLDSRVRERANEIILLLTGSYLLPSAMAMSWRLLARQRDNLPIENLKEGDTASISSECLRIANPTRIITRFCVEDTTILGDPYKRGETVVLLLEEANNDESKFEEPEKIRLDRKEKSLSFGAGPHICLGQKASLLLNESWIAHVLKSDLRFCDVGLEFHGVGGLNLVKNVQVKKTATS